jgi:hypothetical protein
MRTTVPFAWFNWQTKSWYRLPEDVPWPADTLDGFPERQRQVLTARLDLDGRGRRTLQVIGEEFGIRGSRVAQIEAAALRRVARRLGWRGRSEPPAPPRGAHPWWLVP